MTNLSSLPITLSIPFSVARWTVHSSSRPPILKCKIEATPSTQYAYEYSLISAPQPSLSSTPTKSTTTLRPDLLPLPPIVESTWRSTSKPTCCSRRTRGVRKCLLPHQLPLSTVAIVYSASCSHITLALRVAQGSSTGLPTVMLRLIPEFREAPDILRGVAYADVVGV